MYIFISNLCYRHERESCINNVKLTLNCTKDYNRSRASCQIDNNTYTKRKDKCKRGSLENVSSNPWGDPNFDGQSSLRRTRSLAVSGENIFSSLYFSESGSSGRQRRSQLIPRAKLIDRPSVREHRYKGTSVEDLEANLRPKHIQPSISPPDYSPPQPNFIERHRQQHKTEEIYSYVSLNHLDDTKQDSLDSNFNNKTSFNSLYRVSYEDLPGLSLPNYYPDSRYDTDNTDNISITDNISSVSLDNISKIKYPSFDNIEFRWESTEQHESISYDENIVLSTNKSLYDSEVTKPRTIRGPTPYHESYNFGKTKLSSLPHSDEDVETDKNLDEINLNNENITKIIDQTPTNFLEAPDVDQKEEPSVEESKSSDDPIKTLIEVTADIEKAEEYKTIVTVPEKDLKPEKSKCKHRKESRHGHNYLREFLETQKGSTKPLQNFIAKKFSNLSRKNSKESNLAENQFYSLPDITASKNLRKCEKIDRKLRKCEKTTRETSKENRFIVNIGRHFDITANSSVPVDFEVKIAKIPKKNKKSIPYNNKSDEQLLAAVKNLKETLKVNLDENHNISKPEIISVQTKDNLEENRGMSIVYYKDECTKEFKERLGTMRTYWDKMVGSQKDVTEDKEATSCKIIDLHTKVEDVKKRFEPSDEKPEEKPPSKVQLTKQLFEPKPVQEKVEKISPLIKETCSYFENNTNVFFDNDNQFQSLCPTAVEIIDKKDNKQIEAHTNIKSHKPIAKSKSTCEGPEFDHVRYKVVKSDLFQKKIFANCEKESQFDGLMQYLQDYSFQELLIDNNIVIIEPIRSKVHYEPSNNKPMRNVTPLLHKCENKDEDNKPGLNRHFFYHPIRVNKEVNDDELPNPDTVRQVRQFFEAGVTTSKSTDEIDAAEDKYASNTIDPDKDRCSATDSNSHQSNMSDFGSQEDLYDSIDNEIYCEYVSEDILEKIREHGTSVTYYGGRVVDRKSGQPVLTRAIMEEIRNNEKRCTDCDNCRRNGLEEKKDTYLGVKFKILKSNSCSSRLELVGAENIQEKKKKVISHHKKLTKQNNAKNTKVNDVIKEVNGEKEDSGETNKLCDKNAINECIKKQIREDNQKQNQPKIIGEEKKIQESKYVQWGEVKNDTTFTSINFNEKGRIYDYHNYEKVKSRTKKIDEMEFEPYEVA